MEPRHRDVIRQHLPTLVNSTGANELDLLLERLTTEHGIFLPEMIERYQGSSNADLRQRVRQFYIDLQTRGPKAFEKLVDSLTSIGKWDLVCLLSPGDPLNNLNNVKPTEFISLKKNSEANKTPQINLEPLKLNEQLDSLKINVIKSTSFNTSHHGALPCYSMKSRNRGICLMINMIEFDNALEPKREGAEKDEENLETLFLQIGFHKFIKHKNLTRKELETVMLKFSKDPMLKQTDCVFIIVASHGYLLSSSETSVRCSDLLTVSTTKIIDYFNSENCPYLHNIPKVFIFQLCRGDKSDFGHVYGESKPPSGVLSLRTQTDGRSSNVVMAHYADMLIAHSTVPGFLSHRDIVMGCWYFISLCKVFMEHCHNTHLDDLFKLVDVELKNMDLKSIQTSSVETRGFNRSCFLNPGLFDDPI